MKNVIVSGATGFIGRWLVNELISHEVNVKAVLRDKSKLPNEILENPYFSFVEKDLLDISCEDFEGDYDCFYNLAWGGVRPQDKNDFDLQIENIKLSIHAMEIAKEVGVKKFIGIGTVAEYVFSNDVMNFNEKQTPNDMYGAAKVANYHFLGVRARQLGIDFIWAVLPSTYGEYREDNNIITYTIKSLINKEVPKYGNLNQMWDFLYVADVVRALRLIGEKGISGKVYGIGSGEYRPLNEYISIIRNNINPELELGIGEVPDLSNKTYSSCVNIFELCRDTGFRPTTGFEEGIKKTIDFWMQKYKSNRTERL